MGVKANGGTGRGRWRAATDGGYIKKLQTKCEVCRFFGSFPPFAASLMHFRHVLQAEAGAGRNPIIV